MSGGSLKGQWGLAEPQAAGPAGAGDSGADFRAGFESAMKAINDSLLAAKATADAARHQAMEGERLQLVAQFQAVLGKLSPAQAPQAQGDVDRVLAAAEALKSRAAGLAQEGAAALAKWEARVAAFDAGVAQVVEMNDWGHAKAGPFQAVADAIRARVDGRKFGEALAGVDRFLQPLGAAYAEYQKQKAAQPGYDSLVEAVQGQVQSLLTSAVPEVAKRAAEFTAQLDEARKAAGTQDYVVALAALQTLKDAVAQATAEAAAKKEEPGFFGSIANAVSDAAGAVADTAAGAVKAVGQGAEVVAGAAVGAAQAVGDAAVGVASNVAHAAGEAVIGAANAVADSAGAVGEFAGATVGSAVGGVGGAVLGAAAGTLGGSVVGQVGGGAVGAVGGLATGGVTAVPASGVGGAAAGGVVGGLAGGAVGSAAGGVMGSERGSNFGSGVGESVGNFVAGKARWLAGAVGAAMGKPPAAPPTTMLDRPRSGAPITAPQPDLKPVKGAGGKTLQLGQSPDGSVTLVAPQPKIQSITFSGGGGKGAALPGAVKALQDSGVLNDVKSVTGASVGSMTAAFVAAGMTADEFTAVGNDPSVSSQIKGGKGIGEIVQDGGITGEGLEKLVQTQLSASVSNRITEYVKAQTALGTTPDPHVMDIARKLAEGKKGVTFRDLRDLSKVIPQIKEVAISGSRMADVDPNSGEVVKGSEQSQLVMFDADSQPDLEVALAVHASAALPPVFKPVDLKLADGKTTRFQDGGVLNNAPTPDSIGADRQLDPMPEGGNMTFIFEDDASQAVMKGQAAPTRSPVADWLTGAENSAADYAKNRALADRPQDVVMLPLKFSVPSKDGGQEEKDFSTFMGGTLKFDMALPDKLKLQSMANLATSDFLGARSKDVPRTFASMEQMLMCVPYADLKAMAADGLTGAREALDFRDKVSGEVSGLIPLVLEHPDAAQAAADPKVQAVLARLDQLAGSSKERQGAVAREMNRSPRLDGLIQAARQGGNATMQACAQVNDGVLARAHAKEVLRDVVYPKMVRTDASGVDGNLLKMVDDRLRAAKTPAEVNDAMQLAIKHFRKRLDPLGNRGHHAFAQDLEDRLMK